MANIETIRHSLAHLLAAVVVKKFPKVRLGIGPTIENGFYYDFLFVEADKRGSKRGFTRISDEDLPTIEEVMRKLVREHLPFSGKKVTSAEAKKLFKSQPFKLELIKEFTKEKKQLSVYETGDVFTDLCKGGHVKNTSEINPEAFKLTKIAGAYWRGDEKNPMLTRIYGVAFETKKELDDYLKQIEEAEKRDHKRLGPQLELFMFHETAPGMPYWLPKGLIILNELIDFWRKEHASRGYQEIKSPLLNKKELYQISGHWEHYREDMFIAETEDKEIYGLKPMNCPNAMVVFGSRPRSYRELPLRLSDTDTLHRYERSGTLNGLLRARSFSQDDAHIFIAEDQIKDEYRRIFDIVQKFYSVFGFNYSFRLGTRPKKFMGDARSWNKAETALKEILEESKRPYTILKGDGAFYGPKIDILMKDSLGRDWQMGTIKLYFQIPKRFKLTYVDKDGREKTPVVIHRVIYGTLERFVGVLIEHFAAAFPLWLAPVQVIILPISERHKKYAIQVIQELRRAEVRVELDGSNETLGKRIRETELQKIPYVLIVGDKEIRTKTVAVRKKGKGDIGTQPAHTFIGNIKKEIENKLLS